MSVLKRADANIHYELSGNGEPVIFLQGVGVTGEGWRPQVVELAGEFQTLVFDNRGIGRSVPCDGPIAIEAMAEDARALMDEVGWKSAHVVGHSMGGVIAQQLALDAPDRVRSLSLLCTFARGKDGGRVTPWVLWMSLRTRIGPRRMRRWAFLEMLYPETYLRSTDLDQLALRTGAIIGRDLADTPPVLMKQVRALGAHDISARLPELASVPTLVISAAHDRIAHPRYGRTLAAAIPGALFEEFADSSHGVTIQEANKINDRLRRFLHSGFSAD